MAIDILIDVFANSPPSILMALGFVMLFFGGTTNNNELVSTGWIFFTTGVLLQVAWLFVMFNRGR